MKIVIADDEPLAILRLQRLLENLNLNDIISVENGQQAVDAAKRYHPHIIFLDIEMPVLTGIEAASQIKHVSPESKIVFCTAYDNFAIKAFELSASDYLLKPVNKERLSQTIRKVSVQEQKPSIRFQRGTDLISLDLNDAYCFISEDKCTKMHCKLGEVFIDDSLVVLEQRFPHQLIRINRNALINHSELFGIHRDKNQAFAKLKSTNYQPQISRRNLSIIKDLLK